MSAIDLLRALITVLWFVLFVAISVGAWRRWPRDSAIARLPLEGSAPAPDVSEEAR